MDKARVFFTKELTPEAVVKLYKRLGVELPGKVAVKVHSGEDGNQNYLRPEFMRPMIESAPTSLRIRPTAAVSTSWRGSTAATASHTIDAADCRPRIYELLEKYRDGREIIVFHSREEAERFIERLGRK